MIDRICIKKVKDKQTIYYKYTFKYMNGTSEVTNPEFLNRIKKLVIPPQWTSVKITEDPTDYLQVSGLDKNGKTQYIYHPLFISLTDQEKYIRLKHFSQKIYLLFDRLKTIKRNFNDKNFIICIMFRLLEKTHIRIGNECYVTEERPTYGLTTLEKKHLTINGSDITLDFIGKKNIRNKVNIHSSSLSRDLLKIKEIQGSRLFKTIDGQVIKSSDMNSFLCESIGSQEFSCKDFRTYASNILFIKYLSNFKNKELNPENTSKEIEQNIKTVFKDVSALLNHSEAISKTSYVLPDILDKYRENPSYFQKNIRPDELLIKLL